MKLLFTLFFISLSGFIYCQYYDSIYGKPLIVLSETIPWDKEKFMPTFVLYENGQIIYKTKKRNKTVMRSVQLSKKEQNNVIKSFSISDSIYYMPYQNLLTRTSDQPTTELILNFDSTKTVEIYGELDEIGREKVPQYFLQVCDKIKKYKSRKSELWLPEFFEVTFHEFENATKTKLWLKDFPDLNSINVIKHSDIYYSVFVEYDHFDEFLEYFNDGNGKDVEINNKKMNINYYVHLPNIYWRQIVEK